MLHHMFVFGVVIPTVITIALFLAFLLCWFKFNMRERLFGKSAFKDSKNIKRGLNGPTEQMVKYTSETEFNENKKNSPKDKGPDSEEKSCAAGKTNAPENTKQYVNMPGEDLQIESRTASKFTSNLNCDFTDSDADTDYPRLTMEGEGYLSQKCCSGKQRVLINDSLCTSPPTELNNHTGAVSCLVQHTYHFPDAIKNRSQPESHGQKGLIRTEYSIDSEDNCSEGGNSDSSNYGHFVPVSQVVKEGKKNDLRSSLVQGNHYSVSQTV